MKQIKKTIIWLTAGIIGCVPATQQSGFEQYGSSSPNAEAGKQNQYYTDKFYRPDDHVYEPNIRTVRFYPFDPNSNLDVFSQPIVPLGNSQTLHLDFDQLGNTRENFYLKIIHCNADWSKSMLLDMEFLFDFNEFNLEPYFASAGTRVPYYQYRFKMPRVKLAGNYIALVYRESNQNDIILTRRFMVYKNQMVIANQFMFCDVVDKRNEYQQLNFNILYGQISLFNPIVNTSVVIRQNFRPDVAKYNLKPLFLRESQRLMDFNYFDGENCFPGGNEFRAFDIRIVRSVALNVENIDISSGQAVVDLVEDFPRDIGRYSQFIDNNGLYAIENIETRGNSNDPDYVWVNFTLNIEEQLLGNVYIFGALSDWKEDSRFRMTYHPEKKKYKATIQLKQGFYNYIYKHVPPPGQIERKLEGDFAVTENNYDITVYYRAPEMRWDEIIGYQMFNYLGR